MPRYEYTAVNTGGDSVTEVIEAAGVADAVTQLESSGLTVQSISVMDGGAGEPSRPTPPRGAPAVALPLPEALARAAERLLTCREKLAAPLAAYLKEAPAGPRRRELKAISRTLTSGDLTDIQRAIAAAPTAWAPLLAAATPVDVAVDSTASEAKESVFARFVQRERTTLVLRRRASLAMAYPLFIVALTLLVAWPVSTMILPTFQNIFSEFGLELPAATELALAIGRFFERGGGLLIVALGAIGYLAWWTAPHWAPAAWLPMLSGSLGPWSPWQGGAAVSAKIARRTADLLEAKLPLPDSLKIVARCADGRVLADAAKRLAAHQASPVDDGSTVPRPCRSLDFAVTAPMSPLARVRLLRELSECHAGRLGGRVSWASGVAGPFTLMVLGILVGWLAIALLLPLVSLVEGLT